MDQKFPGSCPVHVPHFSPLPGDCSKGEEPLDKTHHLLSGVCVVQLVAWEPDSVFFPLPRGEAAAVKQGTLLEAITTLLFQLTA